MIISFAFGRRARQTEERFGALGDQVETRVEVPFRGVAMENERRVRRAEDVAAPLLVEVAVGMLAVLLAATGRDPFFRRTEAFAGSRVNPSYGLTFWLNQPAPTAREADMERILDLRWQDAQWTNACICKDAPADMVVGLGSGYQRLFVIPSLEAIIVRQGSSARFSDARFLRLVLGRIQ